MRAKRHSTGFAHSMHGARKSAADMLAVPVLDEAFAEYSDAKPNRDLSNDSRSVIEGLIADITAQLATLDSQRRQLARLLETVETGSIALR
jgi:uncharacterized membrane protein